ncbi:MAG TPA: ATP-grasp domain-containing protein [Candidatus Hydrogenedentes bacterium]|nr:ATP-grasp domain-containing protein [Candidatus Hydrogenedentota bacterium]HPG69620.1 ATP-grasp domain-containing protein [Candidatus Hydrogenedentota bacterium]
MTRRRRLLVLGATPFQVPIVKKAHDRGYHVTTLDNIPSNPAHRYADETGDVSIVDAEAVLAFARDHGADGILTGGSDVGVASVGLVCDTLGLPGITHEQGVILTQKDRFRAFQRSQGLRHPEFHVFTNEDAFLDAVPRLEGRFVIKPVDRSGSKGVTTLDLDAPLDEAHLRTVFENAHTQSLRKRVIIEAFVPGVERGGDAFLRHGRFVSFCITNKALTPAPYFVPVGHTIPSRLDALTRQAIQDAVGDVLHRLGVHDGPVNFDVMVDDAGTATVLEMSPRFGGNCIPQIIHHGAQFDEIEASIVWAVEGEVPDARACVHEAIVPTGSRILGASQTGVLKSIRPIEQVRHEFDDALLELVYDVAPGQPVHQFTQGNYRIGHVIATRPSLDALEASLEAIERAIAATV